MILSADRLIFGDSKQNPEQKALLVQDGLIKEIGDFEALCAKYPGEPVERYPGCTIMPGMIDMHIHMAVDGAEDAEQYSDYMWALSGANMMQKTIEAGVTTVRDVSSRDNLSLSLRRAGERGYVNVPRIITCNLGICMTGGHGASLGSIVRECDGEWEIRKGIRAQFKKGADWIKVLTSEGYRGEEYKQEELDAAVDECHRMGRLVAAHAGYVPSTSMCVKAGFDTIEHGTYLTVDEAKLMKQQGQTWVPTIIAFSYIADHLATSARYSKNVYIPKAAQVYKENFKKLYDTGVNTACGTDQMLKGASVCPVWGECDYMVKYGISELQAIECATKNGAIALKMDDRLGQIKEGFIADLIVVSGDPSADIACLKQVSATYIGGECRFKA